MRIDAIAAVIVPGGAVGRTLHAKGRAGLNRVTWDLRYDGPEQVVLRTVPPDDDDLVAAAVRRVTTG